MEIRDRLIRVCTRWPRYFLRILARRELPNGSAILLSGHKFPSNFNDVQFRLREIGHVKYYINYITAKTVLNYITIKQYIQFYKYLKIKGKKFQKKYIKYNYKFTVITIAFLLISTRILDDYFCFDGQSYSQMQSHSVSRYIKQSNVHETVNSPCATRSSTLMRVS